jgi:hypothetical protein
MSSRSDFDVLPKVVHGRQSCGECQGIYADTIGQDEGIGTDVKGLRITLEGVEVGRNILGSSDFKWDDLKTIPTTLQASLMARLDRLEGVREVAQIGACIGREFSYELLAAMAARSDDAMHDPRR